MSGSSQQRTAEAIPAVDPQEDLAARLAGGKGDLQANLERAAAIIQSISDCVVVADEHGHLQFFNRAAEELLGVGLSDAPQAEWSEAYGIFLEDGKTYCPVEQLPLVRAVRGEKVENFEMWVRSPLEKDLIPVSARGGPILDEEGQLRGGVITFHDISERKQAEAEIRQRRDELESRVEQRTDELRASQASYQDLYDHAPDMFLSVDPTSTRIDQCNQTLLKMTGFSSEKVVGRRVFDLLDPECLSAARRAFRKFAESGEIKDIELRLRCADGSLIDVSLSVSAIRNPEGNITHSRAIMRDIGPRLRAERKVQEQQAELTHVARMSTMGELAAGLAHEINQPLEAISAYAEGINVRIANGNATLDDLKRVIELISDDAHRAGQVIRRLRRFVTKREIEREPLDVNETIREVCRFMGSEIAHQETSLYLRLNEDMPSVDADSIEVQQVLINLIRNALDAMREAGTENRSITIETRTTEIVGIEVLVQDNGPGISQGLEDHLFEQFFTSKENGLGMGLAISRSIVEAHGGAIWFASPQHGARAHFTLAPKMPVTQDERAEP